jgi:hypothetical protein
MDTRITDDEFRQFVMRTLGEHDTRMAAHEAAMAKMDRQYDKLLEVQLGLARSHDEHEGKMDLLRATLEAIKDLLRERRN